MYMREFDFHKGARRDITYTVAPHPGYCAGAPDCLVDGLRGSRQFNNIEWVAWYAHTFDIVIDMNGSEPYSSVIVGTLVNKAAYIFNPVKLVVSLSEDGNEYTDVASLEYEPEGAGVEDGVKDYILSFPETSAKYMKLTCTPVESLPDWHYAAGSGGFVFIDEIFVK